MGHAAGQGRRCRGDAQVPPKLFPVLERLTADGRTGAPAKVAWVPDKLTVMFPGDGSGSALRFVSDASTNVEPVPPLSA